MLLKAMIALLRFSSSRKEKKELPLSEVKSILIAELTRLGDVVAIIPSLRVFRSHFPQAQIHVLVSDRFVSLLNTIDLDIQVHGVPEHFIAKGFAAGVYIARSIRPDLACSMSPARRNATVTLASGARFKVGYLTYLDSLTPYLSMTPVEGFGVTLDTNSHYKRENIGKRPLKICHALGVQVAGMINGIAWRNEVIEAVGARLRSNGVIPSCKYVVIHPFSGWEYRTWSMERFNILARLVVTKLGHDVVFLCAHEEIHLLDSSRRQFRDQEHVHFFASRDILESAVALHGGSLFVGNDSGPLHLAASLGVPVIGLFGPAPPELTAPRRENGVSLYKRVECSPCDQRKCIRPQDPCMGLISSGEVFSAVAKSLFATRSELAVANV
ncbi:MAG: glycosyltransferase family 9 protein [Ignavibacteria bacterium]|nr:glycosyltransferase family 9 protein [Ignavibacteria bacterium]